MTSGVRYTRGLEGATIVARVDTIMAHPKTFENDQMSAGSFAFSRSNVVFQEVFGRFRRPLRMLPLIVGEQGPGHLKSLGAQLGDRGCLPERSLEQ